MLYIKILYIIFFGITNLLLHLGLNQLRPIRTKYLISFGILLSISIFVHILASEGYLFMPLHDFLILMQFYIHLTIFHFVGRYFVNRTSTNKSLNETTINYSVKLGSFVFFKLVYVLIFIVQCIFITQYKP